LIGTIEKSVPLNLIRVILKFDSVLITYSMFLDFFEYCDVLKLFEEKPPSKGN